MTKRWFALVAWAVAAAAIIISAFVAGSSGNGDSYIPPTPPFFRAVPGYTTRCFGSITVDCARAAAKDINQDVAWIPSPRFSRGNGLESNGSTASETLTAPEGSLGVSSNPELPGRQIYLPKISEPSSCSVSSITSGRTKLTMLSATIGSSDYARLTWTHHGFRYSLDLGSFEPFDASVVVGYWRTIAYAETKLNPPSDAKRSSREDAGGTRATTCKST